MHVEKSVKQEKGTQAAPLVRTAPANDRTICVPYPSWVPRKRSSSVCHSSVIGGLWKKNVVLEKKVMSKPRSTTVTTERQSRCGAQRLRKLSNKIILSTVARGRCINLIARTLSSCWLLLLDVSHQVTDQKSRTKSGIITEAVTIEFYPSIHPSIHLKLLLVSVGS